MTPPASTLFNRKQPRPRNVVVIAYALCPLLLAMSGYGFWQWAMLPVGNRMVGVNEIYFLMCLFILPLVAAFYLSVLAGQRLEYNRIAGTYQTRIDHLQKRLNSYEDLLHGITDHDPAAVAIFDKENRYWFINATAAREANMDVNDIIGKSLSKILGRERAQVIETRLNQIRKTQKPLLTLDERQENGRPLFTQSRFENIAPFGDFTGGIMVRAENVTDLVVERERRENMLRQVIGTLVAVVDRRDPYAAGHSERVGQLSRALAEEMVLEERDIEAAEIAGSLMNFGKVLVPREILTKTSALTPDELQRVRDSILTSADILSIIDFSGPVVPTLKQVLERFDGTGAPKGIKGEQILQTARVVAVANAFVALVSARAHRPCLNMREAVDVLTKDGNKQFDGLVVAALATYIENHASKLDWLDGSKQS